MKTKLLTGLVAAIILMVSPSVGMQNYALGEDNYYRHYQRGGYDHASTYQEGIMLGWASLWQGAGDYNYKTSQAMIHREQARSLYLDNRLKAVQTYFDARRINREARASERRPSLTNEQIARLAKQGVPKPLTVQQYDPSTGKLFWPAILKDKIYDVPRKAIDKAIAHRSQENSGLGSANHHQVWQQKSDMHKLLKQRLPEYSSSEYMYAKKFLDSLEYETRSVLQVSGVAVK